MPKTKREKFAALLEKDFVILDGGSGTLITALLGADKAKYETDLENGVINFTAPDVVKAVTARYVDVGSDIVCANTFCANRFKLANSGYSVGAVVEKAIAIAREVADTALVALDVTTLGGLLEPSGDMTFDDAFDAYAEIMRSGVSADLVIIETMSSVLETKAAVLAARAETPDLPVICTFTITETGRTFTGNDMESAAVTLTGLGIDALGINCSFGGADYGGIMRTCAETLMRVSPLPVYIKPNAGLPDPITGLFPVGSTQFAEQMTEFMNIGVKFLGGCCGTTPEHIQELSNVAKKQPKPTRIPYQPALRICSGVKTITSDKPLIVGERINPNGKPKFKAALKVSDYAYAVNEAIAQEKSGAAILDVNVGVAGADELSAMLSVVKAVQGVCNLPLMPDSNDPNVLGAALRVYEGKAIVNSVNGEPDTLARILPIVKAYGAAVVGLCLDNQGIPATAKGRLDIARKIVETAELHGIARENVIIDCLTMAVASGDNARVTLDSIALVKRELGVKTILGVSNISFGLPAREHITAAFLTLALNYGLDFAIINPMSDNIKPAFDAYAVLSGADGGLDYYTTRYANLNTLVTTATSTDNDNLIDFIIRGQKDTAVVLTTQLLSDKYKSNPLEIADDFLIPALNTQGVRFGRQEVFLPSLILSAEAASACFDVLKSRIVVGETVGHKIILATVKGDIHDIGKNIVKVILQSYGYDIIDLGKSVTPTTILQSARDTGAKLVGLSGLMTTTLGAMEDTVALLKAELPDVRIMVGGAVVTADYATTIGADYYGESAADAADIAAKVYESQ
ncbi:MAG: homocysteine S-methyltransferase family protein [Oscillospiraceae bacterium]|jgi:5-methyltetrahydrofolate--homocysteine methyltransferase|nr:homocysteine S-methyltransferase family protein [Oscillospiraceae bacterium]